MNLTLIYEKYKNDLLSREALKEAVINYAYKKVGWDKYIEPGEFIITFIPIVDSLITGYKKDQSNFNHYVNRRIDWLKLQHNKEYLNKKEKTLVLKDHNESEFADKVFVEQSKPEYKIISKASKFLNISNGIIEKESTKKRFIIFVLKSSRLLDDDLIKEISKIIDKPSSWLYKMKDELDEACSTRIKSRNYLQHRNNRLFMEISKEEARLALIESSCMKNELRLKILEMKRRKKEIQDTLNTRSYGPKNEEIAKLLNIPKGTVDSSLYYMKKQLNSLTTAKVIS